ncbi:hypothetical protein G9A89_009068 [Geosiphon pyriformis]|nr:hypothetical protein G9A89_009068 [Geosiphon pyriformis]
MIVKIVEHASYEARRLRYIGNSSRTKRRKNQQQREAAKGTLTLHTFWDTKRSAEEVDKELADETNVEANDDIGRQSDNEDEDCNWHNKLSAALENLVLDIKKENVNSEIWIRLNGIRLYLQLVKCSYPKMEASKIVANAIGKGVYHAKCIRSWTHEYVITHQIPYSH